MPATSGAVDISFTYENPIKIAEGGMLRIGAAFNNIGSKVSYTKSEFKDFIPGNLGLGAALEMNFDDYNQLTFLLDFNKLLVPTPIDPTSEDYDKNMNDYPCLLYTSDAADERSSVDLGGRRIIKKKNKQEEQVTTTGYRTKKTKEL